MRRGRSLSEVIWTHTTMGTWRLVFVSSGIQAPVLPPADFAWKELFFDLDLALGGHPPMPKDTAYPERGIFAGGQGGSIKDFAFRFKLPMDFYGEKVSLQWKYITANSVSKTVVFFCV